MRRLLCVASLAVLVLAGLASGPALAESDTVEPPPALARLLDEQLEDGLSSAIEGSVVDEGEALYVATDEATEPKNGWVFVRLMPPQSELAWLEVGDSYTTPILGAAEVTDGSFEVKLDPNNDVLSDGLNDVEIFFIDAESQKFAGISGGELHVNRREGSLYSGDRRYFSELNLDLNLHGSAVVENSDTEDVDEVDELERGALDEYSCMDTVIGHETHPFTAFVAGTTTSRWNVSAGIGQGATATAGLAVNANDGFGWVKTGMTKSVSSHYGTNITWHPFNAPGTYSFRPIMRYNWVDVYCHDSWTSHKAYRPARFTGGFDEPDRWNTTQFPKYCTRANGLATVELKWGKSTTWSAGLKSEKAIGFNMESQSGYSDSAWVKLEKRDARPAFVCGRHGYPADENAGWIMGDYKRR